MQVSKPAKFYERLIARLGIVMGPSAKRRRTEEQGMDDSFDERVIFVPTSPSPAAANLDDSFDDDTPLESGPSLIARLFWEEILTGGNSEKILQSQAIVHLEATVESHTEHSNRQTSEVTNGPSSSRSVFSRTPSISLQTQQAAPKLIRTASSQLTRTANKMAAMEYQNGQPQESGHLILLRRRAENMERQLEENRKERVAREMGHLEEKRRLEQKFNDQLKAVASQRDDLKRQLLSVSMRGENSMNMSMNGSFAGHDMNTTAGSTRSVLSSRPVERVPKPSNKLAWMHNGKGNVSSNNSVFKHPSNMNDTYQHMPTQMIADDSIFFPQMRNEVKPVRGPSGDVEMTTSECQTTDNDTRTWKIETSPREMIVEQILSTVLQVPESAFSLLRLEPLVTPHTSLVRAVRPGFRSLKRSSP